MSRFLIVVSCLLLVVSLTGCAKTVTNVNFGSTMSVTVTLRGNSDISLNRYFMVLSSSSTFKAPLPLSENSGQYEFLDLASNTLPVDASHPLADYYTNFFSTWAGYVKLDSSGYAVVPGPFTSSLETTPGTIPITTGTGQGTTTLNFNFSLNQIFAPVPQTVYFDVITVSWPSSQSQRKIPADHLPTNASIATLSGSTLTINDTDPSLISDPSLDILSCEVTVQ